MKNIIPSVKGTRDFYPDQKALHTWLYDNLRKVSDSFGYQEYDGPFLELLDLYAAKSGEELVREQSYVFEDRGGSQVALRPELTPTLARMVAQKQRELIYPNRWWSFGPFWRYEKPQKGRTREFFQWNVDLIGIDSPQADAEMIAVAASFFKQMGLSPGKTKIFVNDRRLMEDQFTDLGIPAEMNPRITSLVDKRSKLSPSDWENYAEEIGLSSDQISKLMRILEDKELWKISDEMTQLFSSLEALGVDEYVEYDSNIVRGLLYYTGTVFEAFDIGRNLKRSILGGGRYNNLLSDVGGDPMPCTGFAMGDVVINLILKEYELIPTFDTTPAQVLVTVFSEELFPYSQAISTELRLQGINVNCYPKAVRLNKQFKFADRTRMRFVLVIGPDEYEKDMVTIKDLSLGTQITVNRSNASRTIKDLLA